jgi:tetratricopeptide (TPR) repeat protein
VRLGHGLGGWFKSRAAEVQNTPATRPVSSRPTQSAYLVSLRRIGGLHHRYEWQQVGPDHPHVARSLYNLAQLYSRQHCYTKAEPLYLQAIRIQEKSLSTDPAQIAATLTGYARLLRKTEAEAMTIRAKRMWIKNWHYKPDW